MTLAWRVPLVLAVALFSAASARSSADSEAGRPVVFPPPDRSVLRPSPQAPPAADSALRVVVDPRIELLSIVCRLAGYHEYRLATITSYAADVDATFARFADHPAVVRARELRKARGISFNAPMSLAVHVTDPPELAERMALEPRPEGLDSRWSPSDARAFLADLRAFVRDADVMAFLVRHRTLYETARRRLDAMTRERHIRGWFDGFFRRSEQTRFIVVAALLNGAGNYGASVQGLPPATDPPRLVGQEPVEEFFSILGVEAIDDEGLPAYPPRLAGTVVHEFCHSYINPMVDAHEAELVPPAASLFALVEEQMRSQAYPTAKVMVQESLVRAATIRYLAEHLGEEAAQRDATANREAGFAWVPRHADLLRDYQANRQRYSTLETFVPRVASFFEKYGRTARQDLEAVETERQARIAAMTADGPKVVSFSPANGASDVDAAAVTEIVITFDRAMRDRNFAMMPIPKAMTPTPTGPPKFAGRVVTLPCRLNPGVTYGVQLNSPEHLGFVDEQGRPLAPVVYRFTTRK